MLCRAQVAVAHALFRIEHATAAPQGPSKMRSVYAGDTTVASCLDLHPLRSPVRSRGDRRLKASKGDQSCRVCAGHGRLSVLPSVLAETTLKPMLWW